MSDEKSYFQSRMNELGIDPNHIDWHVEVYNPDAEFPQKDTAYYPIFSEDKKGNIKILIYDINAELINYFKSGDGKMSHINGRMEAYSITRLKDPIVKPDGSVVKYLMPKGQGTFPFFPPALIAKYKNQTKIQTLVLTEGYFKAAKASLHGLDIVGLSSITHMKDTKTGSLHSDIKKLILACSVENIIWLSDGDCRNLSSKAVEETDLAKRPTQFFQSANTFKDLTNEFDIKKWFAHVASESFPPKIDNDLTEFPKGLDDALCSMPGMEQMVLDDLLNLGKKAQYFERFDITFNIGKLHKYFCLNNVTEFYLDYVDRYPILREKEFKWNGTKYKYNQEKNECEIIIPAEASQYFRVGDQYYAWVFVPNKYGQLERRFERRMKTTIADDHGKSIFKHIAKYHSFCNIPDHVNFQPVINNCFNVYAHFEHEPEQGEFPQTEKLLKHIFGIGTITWKDPSTKEKYEISEYDLGLDYVSLLYKNPTQILPILCLVSKENNTGKSTFANWLKLIFTQNAAIIGNAELVDNFNAGWATKLLIVCDETKIDKQEVVEKVKRLSTADKIMMNSKGKDHVELDFFGKFIFLSNNEDNFIYASDDDVRYWIRKVPVIKELNVTIMEDLKNEIPAFLHFLNHRKMVVPRRHRGWFDPELIKTEALKKVILHSLPTIEKEIRSKIKSMFFDFGVDTIFMSAKDVKEDFLKNRFEDNYVEDVLKNKMKLKVYHELSYKGKNYKTIEDLRKEHGEVAEDHPEIQIKYVVKRYSIPAWDYVQDANGHTKTDRVNKSKVGRPFIFKVEDFLTPSEIASREADPEIKRAEEILNESAQATLELSATSQPEKPVDDLPF